MTVKLDKNEVDVLKTLLREFVIKDRTGELGFIYGADRFISTQIVLKKQHRSELKDLYAKLGMPNLPKEVTK